MTAATRSPTRRRRRIDPTAANNVHVREFADAHRIRTLVAADGEVVLRCGRRDGSAHVSFGLRAGVWTVFAVGMTGRATTFLAGALRAAGALNVTALDGELFADVAEADLERVLGCSPRIGLRPRRQLTEEQRAAAVATLARNRPGLLASGALRGPVSASRAPGRVSGPREPEPLERDTRPAA